MNLWIRYFLEKLNYFLFLTLLISLLGCSPRANSSIETSKKQGIVARLIIRVGEFDSEGNLVSDGKIFSQYHKIYIYPLTNSAEVRANGIFVQSVYNDLVVELETDSKGNFFAQLDSGKYSIFVEHSHGLYGEIENAHGGFYYYPFEVLPDSLSKKTFYINMDWER